MILVPACGSVVLFRGVYQAVAFFCPWDQNCLVLKSHLEQSREGAEPLLKYFSKYSADFNTAEARLLEEPGEADLETGHTT